MHRLELGGGSVSVSGQAATLTLPPQARGYGDAQLHDYAGRRRTYPWSPGVELRLRARFSTPLDQFRGTAGFGFWNAPLLDPSAPWPTLPQAAWFFLGSAENELPFGPEPAGSGWFCGTLDATCWRALRWAPFAPWCCSSIGAPAGDSGCGRAYGAT